MAEIVLITEESEDSLEDEGSTSEIQVVIEEAVESVTSIDNDDNVNDPEECKEMTLKQETDEFGIEEIQVNPDDLLPPVSKLEKYSKSEMIFNRQVVARNLLETLRVIHENEDEVARVMEVLCNISDDFDDSVRSELMEQFPHIVAFCNENPATLGNITEKFLIPILLTYIKNNLTRKTCYSTLLTLVKQRLLDLHSINEKICPLILMKTEEANLEEFRSDAISLISKLAVQLGKEATEKLFLNKFCMLCTDVSSHIRKACADSFGDFCGVLGEEITEEKLLPIFFGLCKDSVWGVRKACAEVFMPISCICTMDTRHKELANVFISLLCDQSRWVRMASFQTLGPFISTFAKPYKTGLYYSKGVLTIMDVPLDLFLEEPESSTDTNCFSDSDISSFENKNSGTSTFYFNSERTADDSCDNVVPEFTTESTFSTTEGSDFGCHSYNFCTVIEVSAESSATPTQSSDYSLPTDCGDTNTPLEANDITNSFDTVPDDDTSGDCDSSEEIISDVSNCKYVNHNNNNNSVDIIDEIKSKKMLETMSGLQYWRLLENHAPIMNGDISNEIDAENSNTIIENHLNDNSAESMCQKLTREYEPEILSTVTVNGVNISSSVALGGPLNCEDLYAGSYSNSKWELDSLNDSETLQTVEISCSEEQNNSTVEEECDADLHSGAAKLSACEAQHSSDEWDISEQNEFPAVDSRISFSWKDVEDSHSTVVEPSTCDEDIPKTAVTVTFEELEVDEPVNEESAFNHFQYWRTPLPEVNVEEIFFSVDAKPFEIYLNKLSQVERLNNNNISNDESQTLNKERTDFSKYEDLCDSDERRRVNANFDDLKSIKHNWISQLEKEGEPPPKSFTRQLYSVNDQDIVPPQLLLRFLSMTDVSRAQTVDNDIARHCAYSLPAVALTLGRKFWPCLRETYNTLASDMQGFIMQWKVRRTLASSMHQIAVILGPDITAKDLVPIFSGFIKDLDEVRIGILQHISEFLKVLRIEERRLFLPQLSEFLNTDNERNWRFRLILAEQMIPIADLFDPEDVQDHLVPLSLILVCDKVSEVRMAAVRVVAVLMRRMSQSPTPALTKSVLTDLAEKFIHAPKWLHRQIYVYLCQEFITENSLPPDQFAEDAIPHLLYLCWDRVPNVRIAIARCLAAVIWPLDTFSNPDSPHRDLLLQTIHTLQSDTDSDVRYYANMVSTHDCTCLQHSELNDFISESFI